jgi:hypothetical protein
VRHSESAVTETEYTAMQPKAAKGRSGGSPADHDCDA